MKRRIAFAVAVFALLGTPGRAADGCTLRILTSLDLDMEQFGRVRVPVTMNGKPFKMLVDTGAFTTIVSTRTTQVLGLKPVAIFGGEVRGGNGRVMNSFVTLDQLRLGRLEAGKTQLVVDPRSLPLYDGLFGEDFLSSYDLDFDFAKGKLNLVQAEGCTDGVVYWTKGPYGAIPFRLEKQAITLTVTLDGETFHATLDTGSSGTTLNLERAVSSFSLDETKFPGGADKRSFKSLSFGEVSVANPSVDLMSRKVFPGLGGPNVPMLIGMTVLRRLHVYISHKQKMIYVTPATQY